MKAELSNEQVLIQATGFLAAMANAKRLHILDIISRDEMSVGTLADTVGLSQSALSQHLGKLRVANLVNTRRDARTIYYSCNSHAITLLLETIYVIFSLAPDQIPAEAAGFDVEVGEQSIGS